MLFFLDLGAMFLAAITGVGGCILRDLVLGDTPPAVFHEVSWLIVSLLFGLVGPLLSVHILAKILSFKTDSPRVDSPLPFT